jgi:hypothetical protein
VGLRRGIVSEPAAAALSRCRFSLPASVFPAAFFALRASHTWEANHGVDPLPLGLCYAATVHPRNHWQHLPLSLCDQFLAALAFPQCCAEFLL